jgi:hypothetical protein
MIVCTITCVVVVKCSACVFYMFCSDSLLMYSLTLAALEYAHLLSVRVARRAVRVFNTGTYFNQMLRILSLDNGGLQGMAKLMTDNRIH